MNAIGADPNDWDKHFKLMAYIDSAADTDTEFNFIGDVMKAFTGVFDGNHHRIHNFTYRTDEGKRSGLFGRVGFFSGCADPATIIKDLGLTTAQIQTASMFLEAGWDFVGEVENGEEDVWWIDAGRTIRGFGGSMPTRSFDRQKLNTKG